MTFRADLTVERDVFEAISDAATNVTALMDVAYSRATSRIKSRLLRALKNAPPRPRYPFLWRSEAERREYFATDGYGKGIPYRRTGKLVRGWKAVTERNPAGRGRIFEVRNRVEYAVDVQGGKERAHPGHIASGWPQAPELVAQYRAEAEEVLIQTWHTIADPFAGTRG